MFLILQAGKEMKWIQSRFCKVIFNHLSTTTFFNPTATHSERHCMYWPLRERERLQEQNLNKNETETPIKSTSHKVPSLVLLFPCPWRTGWNSLPEGGWCCLLPLFVQVSTQLPKRCRSWGGFGGVFQQSVLRSTAAAIHISHNSKGPTPAPGPGPGQWQKHRLPGRLGKPSSKAVHIHWAHRQKLYWMDRHCPEYRS